MTRRIINGPAPPQRSGRRWLLGGSALCGASFALAFAAQAQTLPGIPLPAAITVATGGAQPVITAPTANSLDVALNANRTVINWASFHVSAADAVTFHFGAASDIVLNKSPTQVQVDAGGHVTGLVGAAAGGNIWFYSPGGVVIAPGAVMSAGNFVFARGDAIVDATFVDAASPLSVLRSASDALIQVDALSAATGASINATGDVVLTASSGDLIATTVLAAGSASVSTTTGSVNIGELTATSGAATVNSAAAITLGTFNAATSATATAQTDVSVTSASAGGATGDITLTSLTTASLGGGTAGRDIKLNAPTGASLGSGTAGRGVFVTTTTGTAAVTGAVQAGDDIEITATLGAVNVTGSLTSTGAGAVGDAHVFAQSTANSASVASAATQGTGAAAGDITVQGGTTASLGSGTSSQDVKVLGPAASLGSGSAAREVVVTATTGTAAVTGAVSAGDDIEVTAATGSVIVSGSLTSTGANAVGDAHVLAQSTGADASVASAATQGTGTAAGDITVQGFTTASLGSGNSSHDIKVLAPTASLGSGTAAGDVFVTSTTGLASVTGSVSAGDDIEVTAGAGAVNVTGSLTASGAGAIGDAHVLAQSTGSSVTVNFAATHGSGAGAGDVTIQGATTARLTTGVSSNNINVLGPSASLGAATAARDIFVTATTGVAAVTGAVQAGDDVEVTAGAGSVNVSGSLTATGAGAVGDAHVLVQSTGGSAAVNIAATQGTGAAAGDITIQGATSAALTSGNSSRDLKVLGPTANLGGGGAARDVFVTATTGDAIVTGPVSAADDIEVTATTGSVTVTGVGLKSTGTGAVGDAHVLAQSASGSVSVSSAMTFGTGAAAGDITIQGATSASLGAGASTHNINVIGPSASLGSGTATNNVFVTATTGVAGVTGAVSAGNDIQVTTTTGSVAMSGSLSATRDVQILSGGAIAAGGSTVTAGRDVAISATAGDVNLGSVSAGDDIAVRALAGAVTATGDLLAGQTTDVADPDPAGAADALTGATMTGHDLDIKAQTVAVIGNVSAGRAPVGPEILGAAQVASDVIVEATNPDPTPGVAALQLATGPGKAVTAHGDVSLRAENAAVSSIQAGDVSAGGDVAVDSAAGNVSLNSALAGDDVVLRAPSGLIAVTGNVESGRDSPGMTTADAPGAGDTLNAARPFLDFDSNPGTVFSVVGFDVNVAGQSIHIGGATIAGRQPSTDSPLTAGAIDATTSDVRLETRLSLTPTTGLTPDIQLGSVIATRDMQIDSAGGITGGALIAGRDVAVLGRGGATPGAPPGDHTGAGTTIASALAGDDALIFSIFGRSHILGSVTSGATIPRLVPTNNRTIDGATEAADQLAIYLHYFDLDDASAPYVLPGAVIHISGEGVTVGGALTAHGVGSDIRLLSSLDISVGGTVNAGGMATFQTQGATGGSVTVGAVTAAGDVFLDGGGAGTGVQAGALTSTGGDVAVRGRDGSAVSLTSVSGADDVVIRGTGALTITGAVTAGGGADSVGLGDALTVSAGALTVQGHGYDLTGHNVDIVAGSLTAGTLTATGAQADVRIQTTSGVISVGDLTASRDVLLDGAGAVTAGVLTGPRDVGVRSRGGSVTLGSASAGDDVVIRAAGAVLVTGALAAGGGADSSAADQAGDLIFNGAKTNVGGALDLTGQNVDVRSSSGSIQVNGAVTATTDARFQTAATTGGAVTVTTVTAGENILLDGGGATATGVRATGALTATNGDVAVRARDGKAILLTDVSAGDDLVLRATGAIGVTGAVTLGGGTDGSGLGDALAADAGRFTVGGHAYDLTGNDIDVIGGSVTIPGALAVSGAQSDIRFQTTGGVIGLSNLTAGRDVLLDGAGAVTAGILSASRDVGVRSTGSSVTLGSATAGDDVVIRAKGAVLVTGTLSAGGGADSSDADQAGDLIFGDAKSNLGGDLDLAGQTVDVRSSNGSIQINGAVTATTDARFQTEATTGGSVKVAAVTAGRDVLLDGGGAGPNGAVATGTLTAINGDVAVRARDGSAINLADVSAGDDVVLRSTGAVTVNGAVTAGGGADSAGLGDALVGTDGAVTLEGHAYDLTGHNVDIVGGSVTTLGTLTAGFDVRVQSIGVLNLADLTASRDVLVDGASAVTTGMLTAGRDVGVRSTGATSAVTVGGASAGDDVVIRANGAINVTGTLRAGTGADSTATDQAGDLIFGAAKSNLGADLDLVGGTVDVRSSAGSILVGGLVTAATDARFQTQATTGGSVTVAAVTAGRDVLLDGGAAGVQATGILTATNGDVAVRGRDGAAVGLVGAVAGDDVVVRTTGAVTISGAVSAGSGADSSGLADTLLTTNGKVTLEGEAYDLTGHDVDIVGGSVTTTATIAAAGAASDVRVQSIGVLNLAGLTAGRDVLVDGATTVSTGVLSAGRDVGVRSTGATATVTVGGASAGDDVVIRAIGSIFVSGAMSSGSGADSTASDQAGDLMFGVAKSTLAGNLDLVGGMVDVRSAGGSILVTGATTAGTDARFQTQSGPGGSVTVAAVTAGRDVLVDGAGAIATDQLTATSGDVAIRARDGAAIQLAGVSAGDDVVLRSTGSVQSSGTIRTTGRPSTVGLGDKLTDPSEGGVLTIGGLTFGLSDSDIDVTAAAVNLFRTEAVGSVRIAAGTSASLMGGASVGLDILIDTGALSVGDLSAQGDIALRSKSGVLTVGNLIAGDDIVLRAAQGVTAGVLKASGTEHLGVGDQMFASDPTGLGGNFDMSGNTIDVKSQSGAITIGGAQAGGDLRLQTTGGVVTISGQVDAGRDIFADGDSVTASGGLTAGRDVALYARLGSVSLTSASAGNDLVVRAAGGVTASGDLKAGQGAAGSGVGNMLIAAAGGPARLFGEPGDAGVGVLDLRGANIKLAGSITVGNNGALRLRSTGSTTMADASVAGDIAIDSVGDITGGALTAGRDIALQASGGAISLTSASGGGDVVLRALNDINVSGSLSGGAAGNSGGPGALLIAATGPISLFGEAADASVGVIDLRGANIKVGGPITGAGAAQLRFKSSGVITLGDAAAGGDISIDAGGDVTGGALNAGRDVAVRSSGGAIFVRSASAGDDIVLRAPKDITVSGALTAGGGGGDSAGAGDALAATEATVLAGNLDLTGATIDVRSKGAIAIGGTATAGGDARFQTVGAGNVSLAAVSAGGDVFADGAAVQASGTLSATRDVAVRSRTGAVNLASLSAGDNIAIRAAGNVTVTGTVATGSGASASGAADKLVSAAEGGEIMRLVDPLAATPSIEGFALKAGDIDIKSGGAISLGGAVNAGSAASLHLQALGKISAAAVTVGDTIFVRGGDFALGGAWSAKTVRFEVTASGGLALGDGVTAPSGGAALSNSQIGLINAPTLQIFLGDTSGTMRGGALSIGTLSIDTSKIKTSLELYSGAASQVTISGAFAPISGGVSTTAVRIGAPNADVGDWTPGAIRVIANSGGSIGFSNTSGGRTFSDVRAFGSVELNAVNDILIGYQDFIDKLGATSASGVSAAVKALLVPPGAPHMLVTAGSLTIRANGKVAQQDVGGLLSTNPTGMYLLGGGAINTPVLVLGRTSTKSVGAVQMPDYIELNGAITFGTSIMTGGSASLSNAIAFEKSTPPSAFYRLNSCAILQPGSCTSSAVHSNISIAPDKLTGLVVQDRTAAAGTADPTVASATNEEVWKDSK